MQASIAFSFFSHLACNIKMRKKWECILLVESVNLIGAFMYTSSNYEHFVARSLSLLNAFPKPLTLDNKSTSYKQLKLLVDSIFFHHTLIKSATSVPIFLKLQHHNLAL
jgi:hypothetical protein